MGRHTTPWRSNKWTCYQFKQSTTSLVKNSRDRATISISSICLGFKSKLTYFICAIPDISELLLPLEHTIRQKFIPAIKAGHICSDNERVLLSLSTRYGELNIPFSHGAAKFEYENSRIITKELTNLFFNQNPI